MVEDWKRANSDEEYLEVERPGIDRNWRWQLSPSSKYLKIEVQLHTHIPFWQHRHDSVKTNGSCVC